MTERPETPIEEPRPVDQDQASRPAGPVPGSGAGSAQAAGEDPDPAPPAREAAEQDVERDLKALLGDAEAKRDEYLDIARRTQADFENYRKRMAAEVKDEGLGGKVEVD